DLRVIEVRERVVEQDHAGLVVSAFRRTVRLKPDTTGDLAVRLKPDTTTELLRERVTHERRRRAAAIDAEELLVQPSADAASRDRVCDRRKPAAPHGKRVDAADHLHAQRRAVALPVVREELALEPRDVHADGALGLAGAALETQIEDVVDAVIAEP